MKNVKILAMSGSTRRDSFNKKLLKLAVDSILDKAEVIVWDFKEYPIPLYDGDLEEKEGIPENALKLMDAMEECDGFLIASPEYNSSFSGVLKNAIDWTSRPRKGKNNLYCFTHKTAALMGASTGYYGGARGLMDLRRLLANLNVLVIPDQATIPNADSAFDENGNLVNAKLMKSVFFTAEKLVEIAEKFKR